MSLSEIIYLFYFLYTYSVEQFINKNIGKTSYISKWEEGRLWLKSVKGKADKAHCSSCNKSFNIDKCPLTH